MSKGIAALHKEIRKKEFETTELGKVQLELKQVLAKMREKSDLPLEVQEWIDNHRTNAVLRQTALEERYAEEMDALLCEEMKAELEYLKTL